MKRALCSLAFLVALALHAEVASAQTPIFVVDSDEETYNTLLRVNPATGRLTTLGQLPTNLGPIVALAAATENQLYAVSQGGEVLSISVSPFRFTSLGNIGSNQIVGLAFATGALYATDSGEGDLYRIQLKPLAVTRVGIIRFPDGWPLDIEGGDLAADYAGNWYLWTNNDEALYRIDVGTAVATPVPAQVAGAGKTTGLAFDYRGGGALLGSSGDLDAVQTHDRSSGQVVASVPFCLDCPFPYDAVYGDMASPQAVCPNPKGYWRQNSGAWPVRSLTLGTRTYSQASLLILLGLSPGGDASISLAQQLIAAKLSVAAGSDATPVAQAIANADALLGAFPGALPYRVSPSSSTGRPMTAVAQVLADYDRAALTPLCVR